MKKTLIAATALSLMAGAAFAGEGNGNPFPFNAPPISVTMYGYKQANGKMQDPFPFNAPGVVMQSNAVLPSLGSAGVVQTVNSLPPGFENGVLGQATLNQNAPTPRLLAQPATAAQGTHG